MFEALMGGGDILSRISQLAPNWNPFPILEQLNMMGPGSAIPGPMGQGIAPGEWDWMNPMKAAGPLNPAVVSSGPLTGIPTGAAGLPTPPAAQGPGVTPMTTQQMAMLGALMPKGAPETRFTPAVSPQGPRGNVQMAALPAVPVPAARMGLADILGRR